MADRAIDFSTPVRCPRYCVCFRFLLVCAIDFSTPERSCRHFVVLLDLKGYNQTCPAVTMHKTNLRSSWRNLSTILGEQPKRNYLSCTELFSHSWSDVAFDHWPTHMNIRVLRRACLTTGLQACPRGFAPSRRAQDRERTLLLPYLFAFLHWL